MTRIALLAAVAFAIAGGAAASQAAGLHLIVFSANRAASVSGEIYRIDASGHRVDLSRSPYHDQGPVVSPDGKRVAFVSDRSGEQGVYEVGIDGHWLTRLGGSALRSINGFNALSWQPHGSRLAVSANGVWIVQRGRAPVRLPRLYGISGWSPDGRVLLAKGAARTQYGPIEYQFLRAVSPRGRTLWTIRNLAETGATMSATWSSRGLLAVPTGKGFEGDRHGLSVYDEAGHLRFKLRLGRLAHAQASGIGTWWAWSPDGTRLAVVTGRTLQVRTAAGEVLLRRQLPGAWGSVLWAGNRHVVGSSSACLSCQLEIRRVDTRTGKVLSASRRYLLQTSPDGTLVVLTAPSGSGFAIQVARTAGGPPKTYAHVPGCDAGGQWAAPVASVQFVPGRRSLVYATDCTPTADLYSVPLGGGAAHRITSPRADHSAPALSPDGSQIAYSWRRCAPDGCLRGPTGIRIVNVDGTAERLLTSTGACAPSTSSPFEEQATGDSSPSWSPDGGTIIFSRRSCTIPDELFTVPASGGAAHDLGVAGSQPAWGPSRIAYIAGSFVWTAEPDGSNPIQVDGGPAYSPAWSPDGRLTYLRENRHGSYPNFYGNTLVVGSTHTTLPFAAVSSVGWSPDGTRLVVAAQQTRTAPFDVYTIDPDGTDPIRLTKNSGALDASW